MSLRRPNKRILILCEGVTEQLYATSLRASLSRNLQRSISVEVSVVDHSDPLNLVKEAIAKNRKARKEKNPYDSIWLFFDHDNSSQLRDAFELIDRESFKFAFTSLCLEHWFILHFEDCGRAFQRGEEVLRHLRGLWPEYHKTKLNHFRFLKEQLSVAIERANRINGREEDNQAYEKNPYCSIPGLISYFHSL